MQRYLLALSVLVCGWANAGTPPPISDFAQHASLSLVQISPTGEYIGARVALKDGFRLIVIRLADNKITCSFSVGPNRDVARYTWVGPNRLVVEPAIYVGNNEAPAPTGELIGIDADGMHQKYLFGYRAAVIDSAVIHVMPRRAGAHVISIIPDDPDHVVIAVTNWDGGDIDSNFTEIDKLNVNTGMLSDHFKSPVAGTGQMLAGLDRGGALRRVEWFQFDDANGFLPGQSEW